VKIYCVRHGNTVSSSVDPERPLSEEGREGVVRVARGLHKAGIIIPHLIHSPKLRAQQTAQIFKDEMEPEQVTESISTLDDNDSVEQWVSDINTWEEDTMIIGHLPFISQLMSALLVQDENHYLLNYSPGTAVCLQKMDGASQWVIQWIVNPDIY